MPKKSSLAKAADDALVQVVISGFPKTLRAEIEADAKRNNRSLSAEIRHTLAERMAERRQLQAA